MKKVMVLSLALLASTAAHAQVTCYTYGNQTKCSGYDQNGNYVAYTCNTYGNTTTCTSDL